MRNGKKINVGYLGIILKHLKYRAFMCVYVLLVLEKNIWSRIYLILLASLLFFQLLAFFWNNVNLRPYLLASSIFWLRIFLVFIVCLLRKSSQSNVVFKLKGKKPRKVRKLCTSQNSNNVLQISYFSLLDIFKNIIFYAKKRSLTFRVF